MPKATLTFTLPEEQSEYQDAMNGQSYNVIIHEFQNWLRIKSKYEDKKHLTIDEIRDKLSELISEYIGDT